MAGLLDFLQSASNTAADTVAAPVDLLAWALRKAGVPVPQNAVGGTQWMTERGLRRDVQQSPASLAGETVGLLSPVVAAAKAPQIAKGLLQVEANIQDAPMTLAGSKQAQRGAIVWHGSPHKFDRFDSSKIGTGEGAQAYGHGLYFAESDRVAKQYADTLTDKAPRFLDGVPADQLSTAQRSALGMLADAGGNPNAALLAAKTDMARSAGSGADFHVERYNTLRDIARGKLRAQVGEPSLYKVDLPDPMIARMLDWDRPFSQQAPDVRKALQDAEVVGRDDWLISGMRGSEAYKRASFGAPSKLPLNQADDQIYAAERLRRAGIPGIRYLDGGSRSAGAGTSNFVVFPGEEQFLRILERNGGLLGP